MKLEQLINIIEDTTSGSVASYNKPLSSSPIKRTKKLGFMGYATDNTCRSCDIIKQYGWSDANSNAKELKCTFCGTTHKKEK